MKVALEGPINACSDSECISWRSEVIMALSDVAEFHNPMDFDCRGREAELEQELVDFDTAGIASSDVILVLAEKPGWGTAMAVQIAWSMHKHIVVVHSGDNPSPWLKNRASVIVPSICEAITHIIGLAQ